MHLMLQVISQLYLISEGPFRMLGALSTSMRYFSELMGNSPPYQFCSYSFESIIYWHNLDYDKKILASLFLFDI
jgi:hypothetical protein